MAEVAATPAAATGWSFSKMLADPNFQLLLANMGKAADPEGAGGVIGGAAANMISSKAAQTAIEKRDAARQAQIKQLIDLHGGVTPKDTPGVTSIKRTPSGAVALELDLPSLDLRTQAQKPIGEGSVLAPGEQGVPQITTPLSDAAVTPAITPTRAQPTATPMRTASTRNPSILDIAPFY